MTTEVGDFEYERLQAAYKRLNLTHDQLKERAHEMTKQMRKLEIRLANLADVELRDARAEAAKWRNDYQQLEKHWLESKDEKVVRELDVLRLKQIDFQIQAHKLTYLRKRYEEAERELSRTRGDLDRAKEDLGGRKITVHKLRNALESYTDKLTHTSFEYAELMHDSESYYVKGELDLFEFANAINEALDAEDDSDEMEYYD